VLGYAISLLDGVKKIRNIEHIEKVIPFPFHKKFARVIYSSSLASFLLPHHRSAMFDNGYNPITPPPPSLFRAGPDIALVDDQTRYFSLSFFYINKYLQISSKELEWSKWNVNLQV